MSIQRPTDLVCLCVVILVTAALVLTAEQKPHLRLDQTLKQPLRVDASEFYPSF